MCADVGCALIHSKPFVAHSRGKIERFFLTVRKRFLSQLNMNKIKSLEEPVFIYYEGKKIGEALQVNFHDNAHMKRRGRPKNSELIVDLQNNEVSVTHADMPKSKKQFHLKQLWKERNNYVQTVFWTKIQSFWKRN
ncbi:hypothetical protein [Acetivibrio saccincola]|uniref:hypothetical protein n=1 Tax=Acetivibrio saccincola TaxID=1677857 RepID=UPI001F28BF77|nr:hypothetical protein [Acetivibrio saccincola]